MSPPTAGPSEITSRPALAAVLLATGLTLLLLDHSGMAAPFVEGLRGGARSALGSVEAAGASAAAPVRDLTGGLARGADLARENTRLRREAQVAGALGARAEALERDNAQLAEALGVTPAAGVPSVTARVVSLPAGRPGSTFLIDRGTEAGVRPDMPVLMAGVLVGRVTGASAGRATVLPVTDPGAVAGVRLGAGGVVGVARGAGPGRALPVELLDRETAVQPGDLAVTSGLAHSRFPAGLPVGRVRAGGVAPELEPLADPSRLELVQVLTWQPPA